MMRRALPCLAMIAAATMVHAQIPVRTTVPVFRLGGPDADEPYAFARPPRFVVDSAGRIFARVPGEPTVLVLAPDGKYVRTIGRRGQGPSEFDVVIGLGLLGDTLWVSNAPIPRISRFRTSGAHIGTEPSSFDGYSHRFGSASGITAVLPGGRW